ncbi:MAG: nucleotidyltransferase domain-containing protein [Solirubrobacteraceae bacterium]
MRTVADTSLSAGERRLFERFAEDLRAAAGNVPEAVWLFGSRARGETPDEHSDVDVLVIVDDDSWDAKARIHDILQSSARNLGLEALTWSFSIHIRSPAWLAHRREIDSFFIGEVDRDRVAA